MGMKTDTPDIDRALDEVILAAVQAAIPPDVLAAMRAGSMGGLRSRSSGKAGALQKSNQRGRPNGVLRGELRSGAKLNVIETLRAAAPWQPMRRREAAKGSAAQPRILIRKDDFRIARFKQRSETTTIFVVDASGSAALHRLAEAKGAVELLLADCYIRRDQVALIAFRGIAAELLLPPTRSLARAKRSLAGLPGGGGTPLAAGLDAAFALADLIRRKGQTPTVILLTDGRANVARDGGQGRPRAEEDAMNAAKQLRAAGIAGVLVDTSPRPGPLAEQFAKEMGARYLPLPHADAATLSRAVLASMSLGLSLISSHPFHHLLDMRDRGFRLNAVAEIEDQPAAGVIRQHIIDRSIERGTTCDQHQRIEIALYRDTALNFLADQRGLGGPIDADGIDAGRFDIGWQQRAGPARKTDDLCVRYLLAHAFDDAFRRFDRPALEFARWQHAGPGIEDLQYVGAGL